MTNPNLKPSQRVSVVGVVNPQSASSVQTSGWIDATTFHNYLAVIKVGAIGSSATVDGKIEQATSSGGAGAKDVTGKAITQLTKAGTDDNKQVLINLKQEDLDFNNGFKFFRLSITPATAASLIDGTVLGFDPRYDFATDNDATTVDEVVG
ncbi:hypothetical protein [Mesorhizobium sp.]|uniref:hypothetical protein n=1 Tax=Mesorhizobium sp. TaxID=1871066 RepID=UPI00122666B3|nr:hypothetical protein [Mesorhizobium sp.]TIN82641.1 MAG: hypothetical protein E5X97_29210 [Mesorhizobium sp.]